MRRSLALVALAFAACGPGEQPTRPRRSSRGVATPRARSRRSRGGGSGHPDARSEVAARLPRNIFVIGGLGGGTVVETFTGDRWSAGRVPLTVTTRWGRRSTRLGLRALCLRRERQWRGNGAVISVLRRPTLAGDRADPGPRAQGGGVAIDGRVYVVGGANTDRLVSPSTYTTPRPIAGPQRADPDPRDHSVPRLWGRVCAVGGRRLSLLQNLATFECYEHPPTAGSRCRCADRARRDRCGGARRPDLCGGREQPLGTFKQVEIFDPAAGGWSRGPDLPTSRHGLGVVAIGGTLFVMSGGPTPEGVRPRCAKRWTFARSSRLIRFLEVRDEDATARRGRRGFDRSSPAEAPADVDGDRIRKPRAASRRKDRLALQDRRRELLQPAADQRRAAGRRPVQRDRRIPEWPQKIQLIVEDDGSTKDQGITVFKNSSSRQSRRHPRADALRRGGGAHPVAQAASTPVIAISNTGIASSASATTARATGSSAPRSASRAPCRDGEAATSSSVSRRS